MNSKNGTHYSLPPSHNQYVSRGGLKLEAAIVAWNLDLGNYVVLDVGSSTGGFVDCLLQSGVARVYSVDTAYGELAWKLRQDPRVIVMERTNALHLKKLPDVILASEARPESDSGVVPQVRTPQNDQREINEKAETEETTETVEISEAIQKKPSESFRVIPSHSETVDLITIDASWTKLELILPVVVKFLKPGGKMIALLKPHYQADKKLLAKGVLPDQYLEQVVDQVAEKIQDLGFKIEDKIPSPILGGGNKEFILLLKYADDAVIF